MRSPGNFRARKAGYDKAALSIVFAVDQNNTGPRRAIPSMEILEPMPYTIDAGMTIHVTILLTPFCAVLSRTGAEEGYRAAAIPVTEIRKTLNSAAAALQNNPTSVLVICVVKESMWSSRVCFSAAELARSISEAATACF